MPPTAKMGTSRSFVVQRTNPAESPLLTLAPRRHDPRNGFRTPYPGSASRSSGSIDTFKSSWTAGDKCAGRRMIRCGSRRSRPCTAVLELLTAARSAGFGFNHPTTGESEEPTNPNPRCGGKDPPLPHLTSYIWGRDRGGGMITTAVHTTVSGSLRAWLRWQGAPSAAGSYTACANFAGSDLPSPPTPPESAAVEGFGSRPPLFSSAIHGKGYLKKFLAAGSARAGRSH